MNSSRDAKDYYDLIGVAPNATTRIIEAAYKLRARQVHPDRGGDEETMKLLNEAYAVLRDESTRAVYDASRETDFVEPMFEALVSKAATADAIFGQSAGAILSIGIGVVLLLLVRFHWIWVLWPLMVLAALVVTMGVFMAHNVMRIVRESFDHQHLFRRLRWLQELIFWSTVSAGGYGIYLILVSV